MKQQKLNQVDKEFEQSELIVKKTGKVGGGNQVFSFSDLLHPQTVKLNHGNIKHLIVYDGLNFCGKCLNQNCPAFQKQSWVSVGYGKFDIGRAKQESLKCQSCQQQIDGATIKTLGFKNAKIQFKGKKYINEKTQIFQSTVYEKEGNLIKFSSIDKFMCLWATVSKNEKND